MLPTSPSRALTVASLALLAACTGESPTTTAFEAWPEVRLSNGSTELHQQLGRLRQWSAPFHNLQKAEEAGYDFNIGCIDERTERGAETENPRGMGYHITRGDKDLIGDGAVDAFEPEFLVYAPRQRGGQEEIGRLVAFDYFLPDPGMTRSEPPELLAMPMHWSEVFQGWMFHIYLWGHSPDGMFENYSPAVPLCQCPLLLCPT